MHFSKTCDVQTLNHQIPISIARKISAKIENFREGPLLPIVRENRQSRLINDNNQGAAKEIQKKIKQRQNGIALLKRRWMCPTRINKWPDPLKSRKVAPLAFFGVKKTGYFSSEHLLRKLPSFFGDERRYCCCWKKWGEKNEEDRAQKYAKVVIPLNDGGKSLFAWKARKLLDHQLPSSSLVYQKSAILDNLKTDGM